MNKSQYKKYLQKWKTTDFVNNKDNSLNIKAIYKNFFNDLTLKYSTQEQRRFFNTLDLDDDDSLVEGTLDFKDSISIFPLFKIYFIFPSLNNCILLVHSFLQDFELLVIELQSFSQS